MPPQYYSFSFKNNPSKIPPGTPLEIFAQLRLTDGNQRGSFSVLTPGNFLYVWNYLGVIGAGLQSGFTADTKFYFCSNIASAGIVNKFQCTLEAFHFWYTNFANMNDYGLYMFGLTRNKEFLKGIIYLFLAAPFASYDADEGSGTTIADSIGSLDGTLGKPSF